MNVLVSGASGLIGSKLVALLTRSGDQVTQLVRSRGQAGEGAFYWNPDRGEIDERALEGIDAVVHLAGESIAGRWTEGRKQRIRDSRVKGTRLISEAIARASPRPQVLVCASAVGYYGDRGDEELTERSGPGSGFLADVVREWEAACEPALQAGVRVVNVRSGEVLSPSGGALAQLLPPFRLGLGGPLGGGRQYTSWITLADEARAIRHALSRDDLSGPVNLVAPSPVTNREFARTLGRVLRRPAVLPTPTFPLRALYGSEFVEEVLLVSARVRPERLEESGFAFSDPELEPALRSML